MPFFYCLSAEITSTLSLLYCPLHLSSCPHFCSLLWLTMLRDSSAGLTLRRKALPEGTIWVLGSQGLTLHSLLIFLWANQRVHLPSGSHTYRGGHVQTSSWRRNSGLKLNPSCFQLCRCPGPGQTRCC